MNTNIYLQLRDENKLTNRALARANLCIEALKTRIGNTALDEITLANNYGKELLLILQNYLIQKYYKKYNLITEESYKDERLFFYSYAHRRKDSICIGVLNMPKAKYYLSDYIIKNGDILGSILSYGYNGFEEIEAQIIRSCYSISSFEGNSNSEVTLILYQLVTIGNCLEYFDFILSSDELSKEEEFMMTEPKKGKFLLRLNNKKFYIDKFDGQLILSHDKIIDFSDWCNYNVETGLEYLLNLM